MNKTMTSFMQYALFMYFITNRWFLSTKERRRKRTRKSSILLKDDRIGRLLTDGNTSDRVSFAHAVFN